MFWLRTLLFSLPIAIGTGIFWLHGKISSSEYVRTDSHMVCLIREPFGPLNPLVPLTGVTREVTDMLFEPLLARDDDLEIRPNLISGWNYFTLVTIRCASEEDAGDTEARMRAGELVDETVVKIQRIEREGAVLTVAVEGFDENIPGLIVESINPESLASYDLVKLKLRNSIRDSFETFLRSSVEKTQIKLLEYEGDRTANLYLEGDTDLFLRELELYYESNQSLEPQIEVVGKVSHNVGREMTIRLRNDVQWHDGVYCSADDLLFTFEEMTRTGSALPMAASFWFVENISRIDQQTVRVSCKQTPGIMLESWEKLPLLPAHLLRGASSTTWTEYFENPVGNGPYKIESRRKDGGIQLVANENYFRGTPAQTDIHYRLERNRTNRLLMMKMGEFETIDADERDLGWAERNPGLLREIRGIPKFQNFVAWNFENAFLSKVKVRRALAHAINLEETLQSRAGMFQQPAESIFFPGIPYCSEPMEFPRYNRRTAQRLIEDSGYQLDKESGLFENRAGHPISFKLTVNKDNPEQLALARSLISQWKAIGVTCELDSLDWTNIVSDRLPNRKFDAVFLGWELPFERDRYASWHSSQIAPVGGNFSGVRNDELDELLESLRSERDSEKSAALANQLQKEIMELQPQLFLCNTGRTIYVRRDSMVTVRKEIGREATPQPIGIGKAGYERVRPWWVRRELWEGGIAGAQ